MKRPYLLRYNGETYTRYGNNLDEAKEAFASDSLCGVEEVKADFWRDVFPVGLLKFGIGFVVGLILGLIIYSIF